MNTARITAIVVFALTVALAGLPAYSNNVVCNAKYDIGQKWLATGTVTRVSGTTFFLLGKDNQVYEIDAAESQVFVDETKVNKEAWAVGDIVRVYGEVTQPCVVTAERVRVFKRDDASAKAEESTKQAEKSSEKEVKIIIEKDDGTPAGYGAGTETKAEQPQGSLNDWQGVVTNVKYGSRAVDIQTSLGGYSVVIGDAPIVQGNRRITLGLINVGDALNVTGKLTGLNEITAQRVDITRSGEEAKNSLPTTPVSVVGTIMNIDYPSRTFKMQTDSSDIVVLVGPEACVQHNHERWSFMNLQPGQRVKMSGYGNLTSGYAAQHIMVISVAP